MKKIVFLLLLMFSCAVMNVSANAKEIYIDSGASGSGTVFRSLEAAKEYIIELKKLIGLGTWLTA